MDFSNSASLRALTQALLLHDFQIVWNGVEGFLCPPLPNRLNYLCWLSDFIHSSVSLQGSDKPVHVLDIGVGANAIYPLLGSKMYQWCFSCSDISEEALRYATYNVQSNPTLAPSIHLYHVPPSEALQQDIVNHILPLYLTKSIRDEKNIKSSLYNMLGQMFDHGESRCKSEAGQSASRGPIRQLFAQLGEQYSHRLLDCEHFFRSHATHQSSRAGRGMKKARRYEEDTCVDGEDESEGEGAAGDEASTLPIASYTPMVISEPRLLQLLLLVAVGRCRASME
jgi:hypothetical protein